ncbi:MAG: hypothetical protein IT323_02655, partial [Anaerolineae bacterium]|nr:hypothetical protein [Anaerolineae bacterium]
MSNHSFGVPKIQKQSRAEIVALIRHTLSILAEPGQTVELRIPGIQGKRTDSGYFTDFDKLAGVAAIYENRAEGIYITLNPVQPALLARSSNRVREYVKQTTSDRDVLCRRWIFVDFDPVRPAGISSSDPEHAAAIDRATDCRQWLAQHDLPSLLADSGNGAHLLLPIDWPNDDASTALVKDFLLPLDSRFSDDQVKVDTSTVGAGHLIKLYGTMARKGDCIPERLHRRSTLLDVPPILDPINAETIRSLCSLSAPAALSAQQQPAEPKDQAALSSDRALLEEIKSRLDLVAYAEHLLGVKAVKDGHQFRLPGNAGFLVDTEKGVWYHHGGQEGGDALDLAGYGLFGTAWNNRDAGMFKQALAEAAAFAGVLLPKAKDTGSAHDQDATTQSSSAPKLDLLDVAMAWQVKHGHDMDWDIDREEWRRWSGTHWQLERTSEVLDLQAAQMMRAVGVTVQSGSRTDGMLKYARGLCRRSFPLARPLVNFRNGTL